MGAGGRDLGIGDPSLLHAPPSSSGELTTTTEKRFKIATLPPGGRHWPSGGFLGGSSYPQVEPASSRGELSKGVLNLVVEK